MYLRHLTQTHPNHALVPPLDNLAQPNRKLEGFLPWILCAPEFNIKVVVFAVAGAVYGDLLAALGHGAVAGLEDSLCEAHGAVHRCRRRRIFIQTNPNTPKK